MTDKTFQELHAEFNTAIGRGNLIQALDIASDLFALLGNLPSEPIEAPQTTFEINPTAFKLVQGNLATTKATVHWNDIQGKPDMCNPSDCPCKTGVFNGDFNVTGNLTTGGNWTAGVLAGANPVDTSGWQVVTIGGEETPFKINNGAIWVDDIAVKTEDSKLTPEETAELTEKFHGADINKFDHDGDGKPGGSKKGTRKKKTD